ncbi:MAG TPA: isochorismatase family cysteine hydrolase [Thermoleophilaceae bacterium]
MSSALIVTDMLNPYQHEDAEPLMESVREILAPLASLIARAREAGALIVYVNDNHGDWSAARAELVDAALAGAGPSLVEPIVPEPDVPFVVKARHSIFYETQLEYLVRQEEIDRVILTGQVTEQCVLYSALDAYVRHFQVVVVTDAVAHIREELADAALRMMDANMRAELVPAGEVGLG